MKKLILLLLFITVGCGLSESETAEIKEQISSLNIKISELESSPDVVNYNTFLNDVESAVQRKEDLSATLKNAADEQSKLELESQLEGAENRIKTAKEILSEYKEDFDNVTKLIDAKKAKLIALENKLK